MLLNMMDSQWNVQVIRGSSEGLGDDPIITRGRGSNKRQFNSAGLPASTAISPTRAASSTRTGYAPGTFN